MKALSKLFSLVIALVLTVLIVGGLVVYTLWPYILIGVVVYLVVKHNTKPPIQKGTYYYVPPARSKKVAELPPGESGDHVGPRW